MVEQAHQHAPDSIPGLRGRIAAAKARANSALRMNSSESVRMKRYRAQMDRANALQAQLDELIRQRRENFRHD